MHDVVLQDTVSLADTFRRRLVGGAQPFPPDDCGGLPGYAELRKVFRTGKDPEGLRAWARNMGWTPEFDLAATRRAFDR
jgi:hypothetical protein